MRADRLTGYLQSLLDAGRTFRTRNQTLKAMRAFVTWLLRNDRLERSPFLSIKTLNEQADPNRQQRRALTEEEFGRLVRAARGGRAVAGLTGAERGLLYLTAAATGFRRKELASLRVRDVVLGEVPVLHLAAQHTKARRRDGPTPIHPDLLTELRSWVAGRPAGEPLFALRTERGNLRSTARMIQADCRAAGIDYCGDFGRADFHALRARFITQLCRLSDDFSLVVDLARHSDPKLTSGTYDHVRLEDRQQAIARLRLPRAE